MLRPFPRAPEWNSGRRCGEQLRGSVERDPYKKSLCVVLAWNRSYLQNEGFCVVGAEERKKEERTERIR